MSAADDNHEPTTIDDLYDRLVDRALAEVLVNDSPPDLSARILQTSDAAKVSRLQPTPVRILHSRFRWLTLTVAASLLVAMSVLFLLPGRQSHYLSSSDAGGPYPKPRLREADRSSPPISVWKDPQSVTGDKQPAIRGLQLRYSSEDLRPAAPADAESAENPATVELADQLAALDAPVAPVAPQNESMPTNLPSNYFLTDDVQYGAPTASPNAVGKVRRDTADLEVPHRQNSFGLAKVQATSGQPGPNNDLDSRVDVVREFNQPQTVALDSKLNVNAGAPYELVDANTWGHYQTRRGFDFAWQDRGLEREAGIAFRGETPEGTGPGNPGDQYTRIVENPFIKAEGGAAVSTFSIDVDTASYANVRQFLTQMNQLPPPDALRIEELINYFDYDYAGPASGPLKPPAEPGADDRSNENADVVNTPSAPGSAGGSTDEAPFAAHVEIAGCPWQPEHRLVRIGIKGREMDRDKRPKSNLVFLVDVSGSMDEPNKLPLVVEGLQLLTRELGENDRVAIVVYASSEGLVLPSTRGDQQKTILEALSKLSAGGSTAGGAGIQLAYQIAEDNFIEGGTNRVILCTDGDFNVGVTSTAELERLCEQKAKDTRVFLSVLGFGRGNLHDAMMQAISGRGNGNHHYVDNRTEARRVLVEEMTGTLVTIAKDVKIQIEFNPRKVAGYRLIGYENRMLRTEDFNDDKKDAGEIGAGHTVTALYEIVPAGAKVEVAPVDDLKYQKPAVETAPKTTEDIALNSSEELLTLKMRYKQPEGDTSKKLEWPATDDGKAFAAASQDFQFATAAAGFGLLLLDSQFKGNLTFAAVLEVAQSAIGEDKDGYRAEFVELVRKAKELRHE